MGLIEHLDGRWDRRRKRRRDAARPPCPPPAPVNSDAVWRPAAWTRRIGGAGFSPAPSGAGIGELKLFHDCPHGEIALRQVANAAPPPAPPFAVALEVAAFGGTFLSLVADLPAEMRRGLGRGHIVQVDAGIVSHMRARLFVRLNLLCGPNICRAVQLVEDPAGAVVAEFDLAYMEIGGRRVDGAWLDLIVEAPGENRIVVSDLVISRRPRHEI